MLHRITDVNPAPPYGMTRLEASTRANKIDGCLANNTSRFDLEQGRSAEMHESLPTRTGLVPDSVCAAPTDYETKRRPRPQLAVARVVATQ